MNKIAHYLNFMGKARAYGLTKEAAHDLYKEAGVVSLLTSSLDKARQANVGRQFGDLTNATMDRNVLRLLTSRAAAQTSPGSFRHYYPDATTRRSVINFLRDSLGKPLRPIRSGFPLERVESISYSGM